MIWITRGDQCDPEVLKRPEKTPIGRNLDPSRDHHPRSVRTAPFVPELYRN